jgi:predicted AlkP superfamily pyrophosphatase or phosphodiesterase
VKPVLLLDVVGLAKAMIGPDTPRLTALAREGFAAELGSVLPAVTCSAQATMVTGRMPAEHGIVGNGWYFRELNEVWLWRQSGALIEGPKLWDAARRRDPSFRCANLFWWYNMNTSADLGATPRPTYPADGSKLFGIYTYPHGLRAELEGSLGEFPFHSFWGPAAGIDCSDWIGRAAEQVIEKHRPTLLLAYLPHLDYDFQRFGASDSRAREQISRVDAVAGRLVESARAAGYAVVVVSEYGICDVTRPVHLNRILREAGLLTALETPLGWELLDFGLSRAFAVADHQVAHVYVKRREDREAVASLLRSVDGVGEVLDETGVQAAGLAHPRSGDLVAVAESDAWFSYYYWLDDARAPDFARTVDIHRKPGFDPAELFFDPARPFVKLSAAWALARKTLGFRYLLDVVSLDASIVKGSHGRLPDAPEQGPVLVCSEPGQGRPRLAATEVFGLVLDLLQRA